MTDPIVFLTRQKTRPSVLLPFHLVWFGRLSKRQGASALRRRLIAVHGSSNPANPGRTVQLTKRGRRNVEVFLNMEDANALRVFAYLLEKFGHVTDERAYLYYKRPLKETWEYTTKGQ